MATVKPADMMDAELLAALAKAPRTYARADAADTGDSARARRAFHSASTHLAAVLAECNARGLDTFDVH